MKAIQRSYIYIATFVSLMAVVWALIFLLQNLLTDINRNDLAWQLAVLVIATPIFAGHWLWAERIRRRDVEELPSLIRRLFLYLTLAALLGPFLAFAYGLIKTALELPAGLAFNGRNLLLEQAIALAVLTLIWIYFRRVLRLDLAAQPETAGQGIIRQLYQWGFASAGLTMVVIAITEFVRHFMLLADPSTAGIMGSLIPEVARLAVGAGAWLVFWLWLQRNFAANIGRERQSILRKLFLYAILFIGVVLTVTNLALLWDGILLDWFGLVVPGELSDVLPLVLSGGLVWGYHWSVLRREAHQAPLEKLQLLIRHIYQYLIAAVGLVATLIGLGGLISLLILTLAGDPLNREGVAGFLATLTAGLPVWLWPWWQIQQRATRSEETAQAESGSLVRRIYLYLFLLIATLTILGSGVYLVFRLFSLLFGLDNPDPNTDLALAIAYALMALGVWLYHGRLLRQDSRRQADLRARRLADVAVVVVDPDRSGRLEPLVAAVRQKMPHLDLRLVGGEPGGEGEDPLAAIAAADIVVAPWEATQPAAAPLAGALNDSAAEKVLLPTPVAGWVWAGIEGDADELLQDAAALIEKLALKEGGVARRRWGIGQIIAAIAGGVVALCVLVNIIGSLVGLFF